MASYDPHKYGLLIAGQPDVVVEALCAGPEFQQEVTEDDAGDVRQTTSMTIVKAGGAAAVVLKPASVLGERRHVSMHRATTVKTPGATTFIGGGDTLNVPAPAISGSIASFVWLGSTFGWARYA